MSENLIQMHSVYIKAPAQTVWTAITTSEYTTRWGYGGEVEFDLRPGGSFRNLTTEQMRQVGMGEVAVSGTVVEVDPPRRLVLDWSPSWHPDLPATRVTWELTEYPGAEGAGGPLTRVVLTHDVTQAPALAPEVAGGDDPGRGGGGWPWSLSGLKTLLETGQAL